MGKIALALVACLSLLSSSGCGNLSPRNDPRIENQNGRIDDIKNNQNGIIAEIGNLKNQADIQDSKLDKVQQGLANFQQNNENSGVQILSGPGGLALAGVIVMSLVTLIFHYRTLAKVNEKTASMMAERIVNSGDPVLEDSVFQAAMYSDVEETVLRLIKKHKDS